MIILCFYIKYSFFAARGQQQPQRPPVILQPPFIKKGKFKKRRKGPSPLDFGIKSFF
jgi:hypothetical protein